MWAGLLPGLGVPLRHLLRSRILTGSLLLPLLLALLIPRFAGLSHLLILLLALPTRLRTLLLLTRRTRRTGRTILSRHLLLGALLPTRRTTRLLARLVVRLLLTAGLASPLGHLTLAGRFALLAIFYRLRGAALLRLPFLARLVARPLRIPLLTLCRASLSAATRLRTLALTGIPCLIAHLRGR